MVTTAKFQERVDRAFAATRSSIDTQVQRAVDDAIREYIEHSLGVRYDPYDKRWTFNEITPATTEIRQYVDDVTLRMVKEVSLDGVPTVLAFKPGFLVIHSVTCSL